MAERLTIKTLSAALRRQVQQVKGQVVSLAKTYGVVREKVSAIAPRVMKLYRACTDEADGAFTLADFARLFDPSVPTHAADNDEGPGYRNNKTYYTLAYMQRVVQAANRPKGRQGQYNPATARLERALATILQIVKDPDPIWNAVAQEFNLGDRGKARLIARVKATKPLIDLSAVLKPVSVDDSRIVHMPRAVAAPAPAAGEGGEGGEVKALRRPGRRVKVAA